jgi:hypothetical protein
LERHQTCYFPVPADSEPYCLPGDLIVTQASSGFLIARVIPKVGLGPWWTHVTLVNEHDEAVEKARTMALAEGVRAWFQRQGDEYDPL